MERINKLTGNCEKIDDGCEFFVEYLQTLGARTWASCEGHPNGFYVLFSCDEKTARKIHSLGFFNVEIASWGRWSISLNHQSESKKEEVLSYAKNAWIAKMNEPIKET